MEQVDNIIDRIFGLVERAILPIILVVGFMFFLKFGKFFTGADEEKKQREAEKVEHEDALSQNYTVVPKGASDAEKRRITLANAEKAKLYKQAMAAEKIRSATEFGIDFSRTEKLYDAARWMKEHKVSLAGTAIQYKKATGDDMYTAVRTQLTSGLFTDSTEYVRWKSIAGSTP